MFSKFGARYAINSSPAARPARWLLCPVQPFYNLGCQFQMTLNAYSMKTYLLSMLVVACFVSCKKSTATSCETTMTDIAGNYKITKYESVSYNTGATQDVTSSLASCALSAIYRFNIDSTATYTELNGCNGSGSGTWATSGSGFHTAFGPGNGNRIDVTSITSWDCSNLVLTTMFPSVTYNYRFTLSRL